jgi:hypothetical protein
MMLRIDSHRWFAMVAILNPKWPPNYKNPPDLGKIWFPSKFCSCEFNFVRHVSKGYTVRFPRNVPDKIDAEEKGGIIRITRNDMI